MRLREVAINKMSTEEYLKEKVFDKKEEQPHLKLEIAVTEAQIRGAR